MPAANTGEWSELYALAKLLSEGCLHQGTPDLKVSPDHPHKILKIVRLDRTAPKKIERCTYQIGPQKVTIRKGQKTTEAKRSDLAKICATVMANVKSHPKGKGCYTLPNSNNILSQLMLKNVASKIKGKPDLLIELIDHRNTTPHERGFSIKSVLGGNPHYFNATKNTRFSTELIGLKQTHVNHTLKIKGNKKRGNPGWLQNTIEYLDGLSQSGLIHIKHRGPVSPVFHNNLMLIDDAMNDIASSLLWNAYSNKSLKIEHAIKKVIADNPRSYATSCNTEILYKQKFIRFMVAASMGLTGTKEWLEDYESDGGFIVVLTTGDVISFHFYDRKDFEEYLFNYSTIETASTSRHDFGHVYKCGTNYAIDLCMALRFDYA